MNSTSGNEAVEHAVTHAKEGMIDDDGMSTAVASRLETEIDMVASVHPEAVNRIVRIKIETDLRSFAIALGAITAVAAIVRRDR